MGRDCRRQCLSTPLSVLLAVASIFYAGCVSLPAPSFPWRSPVDRAIQEDNIRESVFRYRMDQSRSGGPFFLNIDGKDPSDTFMARFAKADRKVKKASQSYFRWDSSGGFLRDRSTDALGMSFSVSSISWLSPERVEVRGGMYCGALCADVGKYRLEKKDGQWTVIEYKVEMVS